MILAEAEEAAGLTAPLDITTTFASLTFTLGSALLAACPAPVIDSCRFRKYDLYEMRLPCLMVGKIALAWVVSLWAAGLVLPNRQRAGGALFADATVAGIRDRSRSTIVCSPLINSRLL